MREACQPHPAGRSADHPDHWCHDESLLLDLDLAQNIPAYGSIGTEYVTLSRPSRFDSRKILKR